MAKAPSSTSQHAPTAKKASPATKAGRRARKSPEPPSSVPLEGASEPLALLSQRLDTLEEKLITPLSTLTAEVRTLVATASPVRTDGDAPSDTFLPIVADLIQRNLTEHLTPIIATLKRLEERIGFISNRLKHSAGGPERHKPWRHDQNRHSHPRPHSAPRSGQAQSWTPPSAASVQGHFAPRLLRSGVDQRSSQEDDE